MYRYYSIYYIYLVRYIQSVIAYSLQYLISLSVVYNTVAHHIACIPSVLYMSMQFVMLKWSFKYPAEFYARLEVSVT